MRTLVSLLISALLAISSRAENDWTLPCTRGVCQYDLVNNGIQSGTLKIWGPEKAISDITLAAGWHILGCNESAMEQTIRLVCISPSEPCSHLFSHKGAEDKIVRLPEGCGGSPFARIKKSWVHEDQNLPDELATRLWKRDGQLPSVYGLELDIDFHEIDVTEVGSIRFAIQAATIPNTENDIDTHLPFGKRSGRLVERSHEDIVERSIESIKSSIKTHLQNIHIPNEVKTAATNAENYLKNIPDKVGTATKNDLKNIPIPNEVKTAASHVKNNTKEEVQKVENNVKEKTENIKKDVREDMEKVETPFNKHTTIKFGPKRVDSNITLFKQSINCPPHYPSVEIDLNPYGTFEGTIGLAASGTIVPPHIANFSTVTNYSADIDATLVFLAEVMSKFRTDRKMVFEQDLPSLGFPGVMHIKPKFQLFLSAGVTLDIAVGARIPLSHHVRNAQIIFPAKNGQKATIQSSGPKLNAPFEIKASPFARSFARVDGNIIPNIRIDVSAFNKTAGINIMTDFMIFVKFLLEGDGKYRDIRAHKKRGLLEGNFGSKNLKGTLNGDMVGARNKELAFRYGVGNTSSKSLAVSKRSYRSLAIPALSRRASPAPPDPGPTKLPVGPSAWAGGYSSPPNVDPSKGNAFNGCIEVFFYIEITVGATDWFFNGIFDDNTQYTIFRNSYTLYIKCKGNSQPKSQPQQKLSLARRRMSDGRSWASRGYTPRPLSSLVKRANSLTIKCLSTTIGAALAFDTFKDINLSTTKALRR